MDILLIILPDKDTALYNRIKRSSDVDIGVPTVCVIGNKDKRGNLDKYYKSNGTYFANVAMKFNLKLGGTNHTLNDVDMGIISKGKTMVVGIRCGTSIARYQKGKCRLHSYQYRQRHCAIAGRTASPSA